MRNLLTVGEVLTVNTQTAPTKSGLNLMTTTVKKVLSNGNFITDDSEPYFGYNLFNIKDIVR